MSNPSCSPFCQVLQAWSLEVIRSPPPFQMSAVFLMPLYHAFLPFPKFQPPLLYVFISLPSITPQLSPFLCRGAYSLTIIPLAKTQSLQTSPTHPFSNHSIQVLSLGIMGLVQQWVRLCSNNTGYVKAQSGNTASLTRQKCLIQVQ